MAWDVMSGVTKTAWDVLSGVANLCGMFCPGWQIMAWDVLSRDVLSGSHDQILHIPLSKQSRPWSGSSHESRLIWIYFVYKNVSKPPHEHI